MDDRDRAPTAAHGDLVAAWARALWAETASAPPPDDVATTPVDERLGGVRIGERIGAGGMGTVFRGRHEMLDIDVALKVMKDVADPDRFLKEARLAARAQHPRIVRVLHAGREHGRLFLVMELVQGANLKQLLTRHGALPWRAAIALMTDAAAGLGAAHRLGIVHRDIKPSNLIVACDGRVKVADLGLAREASGDDDQTETGIIVGTPAYMAPEQARDSSAAGARADVYALGATLFHLLAGEPPFKRSSQTSVLLAHLNEPAPDPRRFRRDVPEPLADLVARMLAKDPARRPADGDALERELAALGGGSTAATARVATRGRARRPAWVGAASAATVAAVLAVGRWAPPPSAAAQVAVLAPSVAADGAVRGRPAESSAVGAAGAMTGDRARRTAAIARGGLAPSADEPRDGDAARADRPAPRATAGDTHASGGAAGAAGANDDWQTPERACFALDDGLDEALRAQLQTALAATGLRVVERARLAAIAAEHDLAAQGRTDPATAIALGRLVGGQIAVIATVAGARVHLRAVPIETGEIAGDRIVAPDAAPAAIDALVRAALALVPAQGRLSRDADGAWLSLGRRHGLQVGDRIEALDAAGLRRWLGTVTAIEADRARIATPDGVSVDGRARRVETP